MGEKTFTDTDGRVWQKHGQGIDFPPLTPGHWFELRADRAYRIFPDFTFRLGPRTGYLQLCAAWAALMGPPPRPETWVDREGDVWRRVGPGVDFDGSGTEPKLVRADDSWRYASDTEWRVQPYSLLRTAWSVLIGDPLPVEAPAQAVPPESQIITWSFVAPFDRIDLMRCRREMAQAGGARPHIQIEPLDSRRARVAVSAFRR